MNKLLIFIEHIFLTLSSTTKYVDENDGYTMYIPNFNFGSRSIIRRLPLKTKQPSINNYKELKEILDKAE